MSELINFAKAELERAQLFDKDADYDGEIAKSVVELIETFSKQNHSGGSAALTLLLFSRLAAFKPLKPLTGNEEEWNHVGMQNGAPLYQNKRLSTVFKDKDGAYDLSKSPLANNRSKMGITFPYDPE